MVVFVKIPFLKIIYERKNIHPDHHDDDDDEKKRDYLTFFPSNISYIKLIESQEKKKVKGKHTQTQ